ncbi:MAG: ferredoxin:oxidoreductase FAD/NAD(P)-binding protein [Rhizobacter sp.]|nr:ferredoxin:oxidoreductase FAD/NAD(P)-binding protein [Rhizobacter sp.]
MPPVRRPTSPDSGFGKAPSRKRQPAVTNLDAPLPGADAVVRKNGFCTLCRSRCGATYVLQGERLVGVEPLPGHPTGGALCAKGRAAPELVYHPQRLTTPLRRTRPKTDPDPGWVPVSWDEALDDIAQRLLAIRRESGAEAVAFSTASPGATPLSDSLDWIERLIHAFGSPNFVTGTEICNWHRDHTHALTFGHGIGMPDYERSDLVLLWGFNPGNVWLAQANALAKARAGGAKLVVIDPARTRHAVDADDWLRIRAGTDAALAMGIARWLIEHGAYDRSFVRRYTNAPFLVRDDDGRFLRERDIDPRASGDGFVVRVDNGGALVAVDVSRESSEHDANAWSLAGTCDVLVVDASGAKAVITCRPAFDHYAAACADFTPEHVEQLTGVPSAQIEVTAQAIAHARAISYFCWTGISQHVNAAQTDRAIALLYALTGHVDAPGGNLQLSRQPVNRVNDRSELLAAGQAEKALGLQRMPLGPPSFGWVLGRDVYRAVLEGEPYRVRALVGFGANLLMAQADTAMAKRAFEQLEFHVHCDLFETPTGRYADYLLPVNTPWEREGLRIGFEIDADAEALVQLRQAIVDKRSGARSDLDITFALATRLGLGELFFGGDIVAGWNHQLAPLGLTVGELRRHPEGVRRPVPQRLQSYRPGCATPTRRIEIYSEQMHRHGLSPVPTWIDPIESVALTADERNRFPLTLTSAKSGYFCHTQHRALPSLRAREPDATARIHPRLAARRQLHEGEWMRITTRNGAARFRVALDTQLDESVVVASHGYWQACDDLGLAATDPTAAGNSHLNGLVSGEQLDALSGSIPLRSFPCEIGVDDAEAARRWDGWKAFVVTSIDAETTDVRVLTLHAADGARLPDYRPGQHVAVRAQVNAVDAPGSLDRHYSLIGRAIDDQRHAYRIAVRRIDAQVDADPAGLATPHGRMSTHLHRTLRIGDTLELQAPAGRFLLPGAAVASSTQAEPAPIVLIAAGIGITPFLSLLATLARDGPEIHLLHGSRSPSQQPFREHLSSLALQWPRVKLVSFYSRSQEAGQGASAGAGMQTHDQSARDASRLDGPTSAQTRSGRITAASIDRDLIEAGARFYLCGPPAMLRDLTEGLVARGVHRFAIFQESFEAPRRDRAVTAPGPFQIRFSRSDVELIWTPSSGSLLDLGLAHGLAMPSGCRVGQCESCAVRVVAGRFDAGKNEAEIAEGCCLACIARPISDMVIDA